MREQAGDAYTEYKTNEKDIIQWLIRWVQANCTAEEWEDPSQPYNGDPDYGPDLLRLAEAFAAKSDRKNPGFQEVRQKVSQIETASRKRQEHYDQLVRLGQKPAGGDDGHQKWSVTWWKIKKLLRESESYQSNFIRIAAKNDDDVLGVPYPMEARYDILQRINSRNELDSAGKSKRKRKRRSKTKSTDQDIPQSVEAGEIGPVPEDKLGSDDSEVQALDRYEALMKHNERAREQEDQIEEQAWKDGMEASESEDKEEQERILEEHKRFKREIRDLEATNRKLKAVGGAIVAVLLGAHLWKALR